MNLVDELLEQEKKVYLYIYSYFDTKLNQFNTPMTEDHDPSFMVASVKAGLIKGTFKPEQAAGLKLVYLGTFCINDGEFEIFKEGKVIVDCDKVLQGKESEVVN